MSESKGIPLGAVSRLGKKANWESAFSISDVTPQECKPESKVNAVVEILD